MKIYSSLSTYPQRTELHPKRMHKIEADHKISTFTRLFFLLQGFLISGLISGIRSQKTDPFPAVLDLANLDPSDGLEMTKGGGESQLTGLGDYNHDGINDLLIGARYNQVKGVVNAGSAHVLFGGPHISTMGKVDLEKLNGTTGFSMYGQKDYTSIGRSVSYAGDVNGDGKDDFVVTGRYDQPGTNGGVNIYLIFGNRNLSKRGELDLTTLNGTEGFIIYAQAQGKSDAQLKHDRHYLALSVCGPGDINGDGIDDLLIGAWGRAYIFFGSRHYNLNNTMELNQLNGTDGFEILSGGAFGRKVVPADDVNSDGAPDLLFGANSNSGFKGLTYLLYGGQFQGMSPVVPKTDLNATQFSGEINDGSGGSSIAGYRDVNGDGIPDIVINAPKAELHYMTSVGKAYIVFGSEDLGSYDRLQLATLNESQGLSIHGDPAHKLNAVTIGDLNGDGIADLVFGLRFSDPMNRTDAGEVSVVYGSSQIGKNGPLNLSQINGINGFTIFGARKNQEAGYRISADGDVNDDKIDDLFIESKRSGKSYVIFGRKFSLPIDDPSSIPTQAVEESHSSTLSKIMLSGTTTSGLDRTTSVFVGFRDGINRPQTATRKGGLQASSELQIPFIAGITASAVAFSCSLLAGGVCFFKSRSQQNKTANETSMQTNCTNSTPSSEYAVIHVHQQEMQSARAENSYDQITPKPPTGHYNAPPQEQPLSKEEDYDKIDFAHENRAMEQFQKAKRHENYDDLNQIV